MPDIKPEHLILFVGFVLPGAISMYVYGLKVPQREFALKDRIAEALCFSLLNYVIVWIPVQIYLSPVALQATTFPAWLAQILVFLAAPVCWPFALIALLQWAEDRGLIALRAKTAWDDFFGRQETECWIQVETREGQLLGGRYGRGSFASSWPDPGHLYLEEERRIDAVGRFAYPLDGSPGLLLRPADYKMIRVYQGELADG